MAESQTDTTPRSGATSFTRSGFFRREIGLPAATLFAFCAIGLSLGGLLPYATATGLFPGVNIFQFTLVAAGVALIFGVIYSSIGALVPHNGADYVLTSRVFGGGVGFAFSFAFIILLGLAAGAIVATMPRLILPGLLATLGSVQSITTTDLITSISQPQTAIILGTILVVVGFGASITPRRFIRWILGIGAVLTLVVWAWMAIALIGRTGAQFPPAWDAAMGVDNYVTRLSAATARGMQINQDKQMANLAGLALALWIFFGSFSLVNAAGEMKKPGRDLPLSHMIATVIAGGLVIGVVFLVKRLVLPTWYSAESFLFLQGGEEQAMPWVFFYTSIFLKSPFFTTMLLITWLLGFITLLQTIFFYASRIIWAWGRDRLVPEALAFIHPSWRSPLVAALVFAIIVQVGVIAAVQLPRLLLSRAYIFSLMALMIIPLLAVIVAAFTRRSWFETASGMARWRIGKFRFISLFALIGVGYLGVAIYLLASNRLGLTFLTWGEAALMGGLFLAGLAWYFIRRAWLKREQINLDERFRILPGD